jgi:hypothetical protein
MNLVPQMVDQCFRGTSFLNLQGRRLSRARKYDTIPGGRTECTEQKERMGVYSSPLGQDHNSVLFYVFLLFPSVRGCENDEHEAKGDALAR